MDNITHTLVGLTVVRAGLGRQTPGALAVMLVATNAPDLDIVTAITGGALPYLAAHRGSSHGPLGIVAVVLLATVIGLLWQRWRAPDRRPSLRALVGIGLVGGLLHVLMDVPTSYGTRVLAPFDRTWFAFDWLPIVDVYVWALLVGGLLAARLRPAQRMAIARAALAGVVGFYALRVGAHARALELAAREGADGVVSRCLSAPILTRHRSDVDARAAPGTCLQAAALPTFFSPFRWVLIRRYADGYELRDVSLIAPEPTARRWAPTERNRAIDQARQTETARVFLDFSRMPAMEVSALSGGGRRVRFVDVRFLRGPFGFSDRDQQARAPFTATVVLAPDGAVVQQRLGD